MHRRVDFAGWDVLLIAVFLITFLAFVYFTWRALRMKKPQREHMAHLPLEDDRDD
jgi:cbb3-type cytochrome oxidase subunit 3